MASQSQAALAVASQVGSVVAREAGSVAVDLAVRAVVRTEVLSQACRTGS